MRPRSFTPVESLPLVGERLCLDFTNTTGNRDGDRSRERLRTYHDLVVFGRRSGVFDKRAAESLIRWSKKEPEEAARALADMIALREMLYRVFLSALAKKRPSGSDVRLLNEQQKRALRQRSIEWDAAVPRWSFETGSDELDLLRFSIVTSATDLLTSSDLSLLRKCGECDWLFVDSSKNKRRRWCKKACGDRVRARRYYERKKNQPAFSSS